MPRYFFHLSFGQRVVPDEEGIELPNRTAARDEAVAVVRDLANPDGGNSRRWASWFLEVADQGGGFFRTPIGYPALEVVSADVHAFRADEPEFKRAQPSTIALFPKAPAAFPEAAPAMGQTAEIVRELAARRQRTAQLVQANERLRRELSSLYLASHRIRIRTSRLISLARAVGGQY